MTADTPIADNDPCPDIPAAVYHARRAAHMEALRDFYGALRGRRLSCQQRRCGARTVHAKRPVVSDRGEYFASIRQAREATGASGKGIRASLDDPERRRSAGRRWYPADSPEGRRLIAQAEARRADAAGGGGGGMNYAFAQADATRLPFADGTFDLVFCSPPYLDARTYGIKAQRGCEPWVNWMLGVVDELTRVCRGLVLVNCAGVTRKRCYQPGPEGLLYEWWKRGGVCWRPAYWHRVGIPGSGGKHWLRADIEYVLAFKRDAEWPEWSDNTANGHPPKWGPGGEMSHRLATGQRVNQRNPGGSGKGFKDGIPCEGQWARPSHRMTPFGNQQSSAGRRANGEAKPPYFNGAWSRSHTKSRADGSDEVQTYEPPVLANPGTLVKVKVGGGRLGHPLAHKNEAPFPVDLAKWFIRGWCKPGGMVLDAFSGSGTTVDAARQLGRIGIGCDLRMSQCLLGRERLENPVVRKAKQKRPKRGPVVMTLFGAVA